jgi:hypothetical protein
LKADLNSKRYHNADPVLTGGAYDRWKSKFNGEGEE